MKKSIAAALAALILALNAFALAEETDLLGRIEARGDVIVATEGTWAPWTYHDESGALVGFDVEVARAIAEKLGVEARFIESEWDGIFAGMDAGRYDFAANGVEVTAERAEKYDFSTPYAHIRTALVVRGDNAEIDDFSDLAGKRTANSIGSTYMELAESLGAEAMGVDSLEQTIEMVRFGRADATLNAEVSIYDYLRAHPDANIRVVALTEEASPVAIPIRKGEDSARLLQAVNAAIDELRAEGALGALSEKYFGVDITGEIAEPAAEQSAAPEGEATEMNETLRIQIGEARIEAALETNETARAFAALLPRSLDMRELNGNEKYFYLDAALPAAPSAVGRVEAGDVMLYGDDCVVLFYESFDTPYSYTPIARVEDPDALRAALSAAPANPTIIFDAEGAR